jgi:RNase H-fold protein (predicted Holliday junction resolvase)
MKFSADMGHRYSKFFEGTEARILPTILGEPQGDLTGDTSREEIETSEGHWFVGQTALEQSLTHITGRDENWAFSPEYRALLLYGISEYSSPGTDSLVVDLILSLPIADYRRHRPKLTELIQKAHIVKRPGRRNLVVNIRSLRFLPQGFAPVKRFLADDKTVVALDWGSRNINTAMFKGRTLINSKTNSIEAGAATVLQDIGRRIEETTRRELTEPQIVAALQTKTVRSFGQPVDVSAIVDERLGYYHRFFESFISDHWGNGADVDVFVLFGGGAILAGERLKEKYPQMVVLDDPQLATVKAQYSYLQRKLSE